MTKPSGTVNKRKAVPLSGSMERCRSGEPAGDGFELAGTLSVAPAELQLPAVFDSPAECLE